MSFFPLSHDNRVMRPSTLTERQRQLLVEFDQETLKQQEQKQQQQHSSGGGSSSQRTAYGADGGKR